MFGSPVKSIPLIRQTGEAGQTEDKRITEFMQLIDIMENQRSNKKQNIHFRENYRKKSLQPNVARTYQQKNFILPTSSPSKTNILASSNTFRTLTA